MDLFDTLSARQLKSEGPLADRMRPASFDEFVGQRELVGEGSVLRQLIDGDQVPSMLFWGPPGTGKTTLARLIAKSTKSRFVPLSAVSSGVAELRQVVSEAKDARKFSAIGTIVFIDEIHRWNKAQQDAFLPFVEDGTVTLIGATTENPSFSVNAALLSRSRVFTLSRLEGEDIVALLGRAIADSDRGLGKSGVTFEDGVVKFIAEAADGDARVALGTLDLAVRALGKSVGEKRLTLAAVSSALKRSHLLYDKNGEEHYNIISALHKSMRGSDVQASLYWLGRMLEAGEDPRYVARRLVRFASEDVGMADPQALVQANAAFFAAEHIGMPECDVCLAQAVVYLAKAPKSVALYQAVGAVKRDIAEQPNDPVPLHIRNAPTKLMKDLGFGKDYKYPPKEDASAQEYLPQRLRGRTYFKE